jgi:ribosome biogenesis GTPase
MTDESSTPEYSVEYSIGTIIKAGGGVYEVDVLDDPLHEPRLCQIRGLFKKGRREKTQPAVVGDLVKIQDSPSTGEDARGRRLREGLIIEVLPRRTVLARGRHGKALQQITVANLDQVLVIMALREPDLNLHRLDRFLVLAESNELGAIVCLNKIDLVKKRERKKATGPIIELYESLGYRVLCTSAETDDGIPDLRELLKDKTSALLGSSGVGKSSLAGAIQPGLHLWVGDVMDIGKGRHTTTDVSLHRLDFGGYIVDTPGVKTVSLLEVRDVSLPQCFPEMRERDGDCKFNNCTHIHEPGCAIRAAAASGEIAASRYESYVKMREDQKAQRPIYERDK